MKVGRRDFLTAAALAARAAALLPAPGAPGAPVEDSRGRMDRHLFLDDVHIDRLQGVERRGHPAKRYPGNPLFRKTFPWEKTRMQLYGRSVLYNPDRKLYQMFYLAQPNGPHYPNVRVGSVMKVGGATLPAYAESKDGIHWAKPLRRDVPFENFSETNLLDLNFGASFEPSVMWDEHDPDPSRRYKAFVWDQRYELPVAGKLDYRRAAPSLAFPRGLIISQLIRDDSGKVIYEKPYDDYGIMVAFSADGIHWRKHPDWYSVVTPIPASRPSMIRSPANTSPTGVSTSRRIARRFTSDGTWHGWRAAISFTGPSRNWCWRAMMRIRSRFRSTACLSIAMRASI